MTNILVMTPSLGQGGYHRLIVDMAIGLRRLSDSIEVITNHVDEDLPDEEVTDGLVSVTVLFDWFPNLTKGPFLRLCRYIQFLLLTLSVIIGKVQPKPLMIFCFGSSSTVPLLRFFGFKVVYYAHRLNDLNTWSSKKSSKILLSSPSLIPVVNKLHPKFKACNVDFLYPTVRTSVDISDCSLQDISENLTVRDAHIILSINRFEISKQIDLSIEAMYQLKRTVLFDTWRKICLVIVGHYNINDKEHFEYFTALNELCERLEVSNNVIFLPSATEKQKTVLLRACKCVVYTANNSHLSLIPIEAMRYGKPVVASRFGGCSDAVLQGYNGYICKPIAVNIAGYLYRLLVCSRKTHMMGFRAIELYNDRFCFDAMLEKLDDIVMELVYDR